MSLAQLSPINGQPFRHKDPWLDVRGYLVNGWRSAGSQTFCVAVRGNEFTLMMRVRGEDATGSYIAEGIPVAPPYVVRFQGHLNGDAIWLAMNASGGIVPSGQGFPVNGEIAAIATFPRGQHE